MKKKNAFSLIFISLCMGASAQVLTKEDSLNAHLTANNNATEISGYGQAKVQYNVPFGTATADLTRNVLFVGHKFSNNISFFSEWEIEDAVVSGGSPGGEVSMEQCFLKFDLNKDNYLVGGLFTPRIGIMNENHLPTTFFGNDRPFVETLIIPSTWREIGIGLYGDIPSVPGLNYSIGLVNGLNSQGFSMDQGIGEDGQFQGKNATASNIAVTGALLYYIGNFRIQASGYYGGSVGLAKRQADSLHLEYGPFGTPVALEEADVQYFGKLITIKALGTVVQIPDAASINSAYANNPAQEMMGAYAEVGINLAYLFNHDTKRNLTLFVRDEYCNLDAVTPFNGLVNGADQQHYFVSGLAYFPIKGIAIKLDYVLRTSGAPNPALNISPFATPPVYYTSNGFVDLGIGYSF